MPKSDYQNCIDYKHLNKVIDTMLDEVQTRIQEKTMINSSETNSIDKSVSSLLPQKMCTGCSACVCICPTKALKLTQDEWGYYRSTIDATKCINCGKCSNICPAINLPGNSNIDSPTCYAFIAADEHILFNSSSGGAFALMSEVVFQKHGCVSGAAWKSDFSVEHIIIDRLKDLHILQKSKYLQSYMGDVFESIKSQLEQGRFTLFSGCPCQVTGLKAFLRKEYNNLLTVDLLCSHTPSTTFFKKYLKDSFPNGIQNYQFRHKEQDWNSDCATVTVTESDGSKHVRRGGRQDNYQRVFHNHTMCPEHCEKCKYQTIPRIGDITIGDFWNIGEKDKSINTQQGISVVLCNNEKGKNFLESIPKEKIGLMKEVPLMWLGGNGYALKGTHNFASTQRNTFYEAIKTMCFSDAVDYALKPSHGKYNEVYTRTDTFLQYDVTRLRFQFDSSLWKEQFINQTTVLTPVSAQAKAGQYAILPLCKALEKGKKYVFSIKFKVKTQSKTVNFHIKDSGSRLFQVINSYSLPTNFDANQWVKYSVLFVPDSDIYDEFMIGASQITGNERAITFSYINICEAK
ncbi:Coenzyme F420 hydrogenase/dehydrogenase, beta subunit C-terminal domain [Lachnospiraceae bacterium OttesenSCG-928-D06]|nr:Coenzyme F420 hydrogenase/dehydrogenase, beta subunit C-terminal domain [Lachnospiraceae bacterium OttesenSCG-928-D06]